MMRQDDLFAARPLNEPLPPEVPEPSAIRERLTNLLAVVRTADDLPWEPQRARVQANLFHNMANWLPSNERDALRSEFAAELARLQPARLG